MSRAEARGGQPKRHGRPKANGAARPDPADRDQQRKKKNEKRKKRKKEKRDKEHRDPAEAQSAAKARGTRAPVRADAQPIASPIASPLVDFEVLYPLRTCSAENAPALTPEKLQEILTAMIWNRELDERLTKLQRQGRIGFHIGSIGEEALMIGVAASMRASDWVVPCYREMGVALYRGMGLDQLLANMYGNEEDPVFGRQMPCHYVDRAHHFLSISSPVATQITQAAGMGWAMRLRKTEDATVVFFGDGATSEGDFHCGLNFAAVYNAATVFVCRNNQWAISTPYEVQTASKTIAQKAIAYGMAAERVDGNDVLAVYQATTDALLRARSGQGPTLLEMLTYRVGAHSTSDDPRAYRAEEDVTPWRQKDPILRFSQHLIGRGLWTDARTEDLKKQIAAEVQQAVTRAEEVPAPKIETMFEDVFASPTAALVEQRDELITHLGAGFRPRKHS